jgi:hypothetical protein
VFPFYFADRFSGAVVHLTAMIVDSHLFQMDNHFKTTNQHYKLSYKHYKLKLQTKMPTSETDAGILASKLGTG